MSEKASGESPLPLRQWAALRVELSAAGSSLWLDSRQVGLSSGALPCTLDGGPHFLGRAAEGDSSGYFHGALSDVRILHMVWGAEFDRLPPPPPGQWEAPNPFAAPNSIGGDLTGLGDEIELAPPLIRSTGRSGGQLNAGGVSGGMWLSNDGPNERSKHEELVFDLGEPLRLLVSLQIKGTPDGAPGQFQTAVREACLEVAPSPEGPWTRVAARVLCPASPGWHRHRLLDAPPARFARLTVLSSQRAATHVRMFGLKFGVSRDDSPGDGETPDGTEPTRPPPAKPTVPASPASPRDREPQPAPGEAIDLTPEAVSCTGSNHRLNRGGMWLSADGPCERSKREELTFPLTPLAGRRCRLRGIKLKVVPDEFPSQTASAPEEVALDVGPSADGPWVALPPLCAWAAAAGWIFLPVRPVEEHAEARFMRLRVLSSRQASPHVRLFGVAFVVVPVGRRPRLASMAAGPVWAGCPCCENKVLGLCTK